MCFLLKRTINVFHLRHRKQIFFLISEQNINHLMFINNKTVRKINKHKCRINRLIPRHHIFRAHARVFLGVNMCVLKKHTVLLLTHTPFTCTRTHTHTGTFSHSRPPARFLANSHKSVIRNEVIAGADPVWINSRV